MKNEQFYNEEIEAEVLFEIKRSLTRARLLNKQLEEIENQEVVKTLGEELQKAELQLIDFILRKYY